MGTIDGAGSGGSSCESEDRAPASFLVGGGEAADRRREFRARRVCVQGGAALRPRRQSAIHLAASGGEKRRTRRWRGTAARTQSNGCAACTSTAQRWTSSRCSTSRPSLPSYDRLSPTIMAGRLSPAPQWATPRPSISSSSSPKRPGKLGGFRYPDFRYG
jgi:hypothetical protein